MIAKCLAHPRYQGKREPNPRCMGCQIVFLSRRVERLEWEVSNLKAKTDQRYI